jgi:hypothetical protein
MDVDRRNLVPQNDLSEHSWYLVRTKAGEERRAHDQVRRVASDILLPLVKVRVRR